MIPVMQTLLVKRDGTGNCFNACVASLLEIPLETCNDILPGQGGKHWFRRWQKWFKERGLSLDICSKDQPPKGYAIVSVDTDRIFPEGHAKAGETISHACIALDGVIVHDPYPGGCPERYTVCYYYLIEPYNPDNDF